MSIHQEDSKLSTKQDYIGSSGYQQARKQRLREKMGRRSFSTTSSKAKVGKRKILATGIRLRGNSVRDEPLNVCEHELDTHNIWQEIILYKHRKENDEEYYSFYSNPEYGESESLKSLSKANQEVCQKASAKKSKKRQIKAKDKEEGIITLNTSKKSEKNTTSWIWYKNTKTA
jgi:hypothetical protein